jgi:hypothetical protein
VKSANEPVAGLAVSPAMIDSRFAPPLRLPGKPDQTLAPWDYMSLTDQSRDPTLLGRHWGLTEEALDTIDKGGFELFGVEYAALELIAYTTGDKLGPRPRLVARYDRALAARGLLEEVTVLEVVEGGRYKPICVAGLRGKLNHDEASRAEFFAFRREYLRLLVGKRDNAERQVAAIQDRDRELKAFFDQKQARSRRKRSGGREVSAQPIRQADLRKEEESKLGKALLSNAPADPAESARDSITSGGGARPSKAFTRVKPESKKGLGEALGGASGFTSGQSE